MRSLERYVHASQVEEVVQRVRRGSTNGDKRHKFHALVQGPLLTPAKGTEIVDSAQQRQRAHHHQRQPDGVPAEEIAGQCRRQDAGKQEDAAHRRPSRLGGMALGG